jgi:hypothetical protein
LTHFPEKGKTGSMSLREIDFGNLAEWVSAIAAIVTAVIVFVQIQDLRRTVQNQTSQAVYSEMLSLDRFFFQNCEFREYFYEGQEPPADKKAQARIVAKLLCDLADYVCLQKKTMAPDTFKEWQTYMRFLSDKSPILQDAIVQRQTWYDSRLGTQMFSIPAKPPARP